MEISKIKILAIDDNQDNLITIKALIKESFPEALIFTALTGSKGIGLAKSEDPDVILLDIVMPEMDGFEVCKVIKADKELLDIPVVFVTANKRDHESRIYALECGAEAFLAKPLDEIELTTQIRAMAKIKAAANTKKNEKKRLEELVAEKTQELHKTNLTTLRLLADLRRENDLRIITEKALIASEEHYRAVAQSAQDGIITIDSKGIIVGWNKGAEIIFGYSDAEAVGKESSLIIPQKYVIQHDLGLNRVVHGGEHHVIGRIVELHGLHKNGQEIPIELSLSEWESGSVKFFTAIIRDITEREQNLKSLRRSEELFRSIIHNSADITALTDEDDNCLFISPQCNSILGIAGEQFIGQKIPFNFHPEDSERCSTEWHRFKSGNFELRNYEYRIINGRGEIKWLSHTAKKVQLDHSGFTIQSTIRDISVSKQVQEDLEKSEEKYRIIFDNVQDVFYRVSLEGIILEISPSIKHISYFKVEDLLGKPVDNIYYKPVDREILLNSLMQKGSVTDYELRIKTKNDDIKHVSVNARLIYDSSGHPKYIDGSLRDISDRIEAQEILQRNEERLSAIFKAMSEGFSVLEVICDETGKPCDFRYIDANPAFVKQTGLKIADTLGHTLLELFPTTEPYWIERYGNVGLTGEPVTFDAMFGPLNIYYHVNAFQIAHGLLGTMITDINDQIEAALKLVEAKERAEESDRLKSAFLANMSHEIRTPMNGILGFAELLKEPKLTGEEQAEYIEIIEKSGMRMLNIINDVVDISKIESGQMTLNIRESNINEQLEYIYTFFKPEVDAKEMQLSFKNSLPSNESIINTDREKVFAILTNLVKNAIKYSDKGSIEFGYILNTTSEPYALEFYVRDTGIGIPKGRQEAIFERFVQADIGDERAYQGAGLGLAITKSYVEMLGGRIWVESEEGKGSKFYFTLPYNGIRKEKKFNESIVPSADTISKIKSLKILIAEDDKDSAKILQIIMKKHCHNIITVSTGTEVVETCRIYPDIDLILMDIQMPGMDGYEATRQIRQFNTDVIIIAQTAFALSGDYEKAISAGCNDHIPKPIKTDQLIGLVGKYFIN